jgi:hypothetical protein
MKTKIGGLQFRSSCVALLLSPGRIMAQSATVTGDAFLEQSGHPGAESERPGCLPGRLRTSNTFRAEHGRNQLQFVSRGRRKICESPPCSPIVIADAPAMSRRWVPITNFGG